MICPMCQKELTDDDIKEMLKKRSLKELRDLQEMIIGLEMRLGG